MDECLGRLSQVLSGRTILLHEALPSAQQDIAVALIKAFDPKYGADESSRDAYPSPEWDHELRPADDGGGGGGGGTCVVVRRWLRMSRWWNLNAPAVLDPSSTVHDMARWEVAGYRVARKALGDLVPRVLYSSIDQNEYNEPQTLPMPPWSVFEHMTAKSGAIPSSYWQQSMVKVRHEFGFDEPHPRWGRVPSELCLDYSYLVLHQVMLPLHRYCRNRSRRHPRVRDVDEQALCGYRASGVHSSFTFSGMVAIYGKAHESLSLQCLDHQLISDGKPSEPLYLQGQFRRALDVMGQGIRSLNCLLDSAKDTIPAMDLVLCHMDFQPQNLLFAPNNPESIMAVLDWEEAAFADPRFDLLLLGRKVCANEQQARALWDAYDAQMEIEEREEGVEPEAAAVSRLGPIEPWLHLETVHSLATLLLQAAGSGGRSPWEAQPELWDKIERELKRLKQHQDRGGRQQN